MVMNPENQDGSQKKIIITQDGPYILLGGIHLVRKTQVVSECGEPLAWKLEGAWEPAECYALCRCGNSHDKPFCDGTHCKLEFDGCEVADPRPTVERQVALPGSARITVRRDESLCSKSGFCGNRLGSIDQLVLQADDPNLRASVIAMVEHCPSGALTYSLEGDEPIEPDLPMQLAVTTDITAEGPVRGALWVTGGIPVECTDGQTLEVRNRVTLCCCGRSANKPLCDGAHRENALSENSGTGQITTNS